MRHFPLAPRPSLPSVDCELKGRTYTCQSPVSSETYDSHFPSGENAPCISLNSDRRIGNGFRCPFMGSAQISQPVAESSSSNRSNSPSRDQSVGIFRLSDFRMSDSGSLTLTDFWYRSIFPSRFDANAMVLPS